MSDIRHERVYSTDRLGIPLIETVTYPDMQTPEEVKEAAFGLRGLRERATQLNGELILDDGEAGGARIRFMLPLMEEISHDNQDPLATCR